MKMNNDNDILKEKEERINVSIIGGSGYTGGELIRLLLFHPNVNLQQVTSERYASKFVYKAHPNLRNVTDLKFCSINELSECDLLFLALPHGESMNRIDEFRKISSKIIDLSGDFRLNDSLMYEKWYGHEHTKKELLSEFVYGIPEIHREKMKTSSLISSAGCNATATILGLLPLYREGIVDPLRTCVEVKAGSSEGGNKFSFGSHHPERSGAVRSFKPTGHRHSAEMIQELEVDNINFSATSIEMVRGILCTSHVFLKEKIEEKDVWKIYRKHYGTENFIRIVKEREGIYRFPEPKLLSGTNFCDIGFELDKNSNRLVVVSAIDNLMKGASGQAVQAMNIMHGFEEKTGLEFPGLHPI